LDPIRLLVNTIAGLAIAFYYLGIIYLGYPREKPNIPLDAMAFLTGTITGIGGTLATYFGAVIGLNTANNTLNKAQAGDKAKEVTRLSRLQLCAAWSYVLSLVVALIL
jgi:hypothetical protein